MSLFEINVKGLSVTLDGNTIVKDISFKLKSSEKVCIVGANGTGKSILAKALCFLLPYKGEIYWEDKLVECSIELKRRTSYLSQNPYFFKGDVSYNLTLPLNIRGYSKTEASREVKEKLRDFNLLDLEKRNPQKLSGGQLQKLALIQALLPNPDFLVLDEPTSSIDTESTLWIEETISDLRKSSNICMLWITHDLLQARRISDRLLVISDNTLTLDGDFSDIIRSDRFKRIQDDLKIILS